MYYSHKWHFYKGQTGFCLQCITVYYINRMTKCKTHYSTYQLALMFQQENHLLDSIRIHLSLIKALKTLTLWSNKCNYWQVECKYTSSGVWRTYSSTQIPTFRCICYLHHEYINTSLLKKTYIVKHICRTCHDQNITYHVIKRRNSWRNQQLSILNR